MYRARIPGLPIGVDVAVACVGRYPMNTKRSVGKAEITNAASTALAPGSGATRRPESATARTSGKPGSETDGIPASLTSAILSPHCNRPTMAGAKERSLCS